MPQILLYVTVPEIHLPESGSHLGKDISCSEAIQGKLLLTLRRRKSIQRSIHIDPIAFLDHSYHGITLRYLQNSSNWKFNTFTLDALSGGHSLSNLLFYLFSEYKFIETFNLDVVNMWRCFRKFLIAVLSKQLTRLFSFLHTIGFLEAGNFHELMSFYSSINNALCS